MPFELNHWNSEWFSINSYDSVIDFLGSLTSRVKFTFSEKATKIDKIFTVKSTVKIWAIFVAFLENMNFTTTYNLDGWVCQWVGKNRDDSL